MRIYREALGTGHINEERAGGLYFTGELAPAQAFMRKSVATRVTTYWTNEQWSKMMFRVEFSYGPDLFDASDVAEDGQADNEEDAWRYALGAALGSYEDPIVEANVGVDSL